MTRVAVVTGASRGIGRACAIALAKGGYDVALLGRDIETLEAVSTEIESLGRKTFILQADAGNLEQLQTALSSLEAIDVLVNNVGTNIPEPLLQVTPEHFDQIFNLNVRAAYFATQVAVQNMQKRKNGGVIINISSQMGHVGAVNRSAYCASKHALEGMTKALAVELAPFGIRVVSVAPTFIETDLTRPMLEQPEFQNSVLSSIPLGRIGSPEDVAQAVVFVASAGMMTGSSLLIDGGWTAK